MVILYHYTDKQSFVGILTSRRILAQQPPNRNFPFGVYLTELPPETPIGKLVLNNFDDMRGAIDDPKLTAKLKYYFLLDSDDFSEAYKRHPSDRNVWVIPHHILLDELLDCGLKTNGGRSLCVLYAIEP